MIDLAERPTMAPEKRDDTTTKIDREVLADCQTVAKSLRISASKYISDRLRPLVKQDLERELARRTKPTPPPKPKSKP